MAADKTDFTQGSILKKMVAFMIPVLGALTLQAAYGAVDLLVVGRYGSTSGLSAVSTGSQVLNLVTFVVTQLAMGVTVLIARYLGKTGRTDWFCNRRIRSCICWDIRSAVYFNGVLCKCKTKIQIFLPNGSWYVTLSTENKGNEVLP